MCYVEANIHFFAAEVSRSLCLSSRRMNERHSPQHTDQQREGIHRHNLSNTELRNLLEGGLAPKSTSEDHEVPYTNIIYDLICDPASRETNTKRYRVYLTPFAAITMGLVISSPSDNGSSTSSATQENQTMPIQTPRRRKLPPRPSAPPNTILRRSRRIPKANPNKVVFPTYPEAKSPFRKSYPLTPRTRGKISVKPILRTPKFTKKKIHKKMKKVKQKMRHTSILEMVPGSPDSVGTAATECL